MLLPTLAAAEPIGRAVTPGNLELLRTLLLDFTTPTEQPFPRTVDDFAALGVAAASSVWPCEESIAAAGLEDVLGSNPMATVTGTPKVGLHLVGAYHQGTLYRKRAIEATANGQRFAVASTSLLDVDAGADWSLFLVCRRRRRPAANVVIASKHTGTVGWLLRFKVNGTLELEATGSDLATVTLAFGSDFCDGAIHGLVLRWNNSTRSFKVNHGQGGEGALALAGASASNAAALGVLGEGVQIGYLAAWQGTDLGSTAFDKVWKHGAVPTPTGTTLTTYQRGSTYPIAQLAGDATELELGKVFARWSENTTRHQFRVGYHPSFSHAGKLGWAQHPSIFNFCIWSEDLDQWTGVNCNVTSNADENPDGFFGARLLTQTVALGHRKLTVTGLSGSSVYTVWLANRLEPGVKLPQTAMVKVLDGATETTERASAGFTINPGWGLFAVTFTTGVGETSVVLRLYPSDDGAIAKAASFSHVQVILGDYEDGSGSYDRPPPYAPTYGAMAEARKDFFKLSFTAGAAVKAIRGAARAVVATTMPTETADRFLFETGLGGERVVLLLDGPSNDRLRLRCYDSGGTVRQDFVADAGGSTTLEQVLLAAWDSQRDIAGHAPHNAAHEQRVAAGAPQVTRGHSTTWTATETIDELYLGSNASFNLPFGGHVAELRLYSKPLPITAAPSAPKDGPATVYVPTTVAEWQALGITPPRSWWLMQEAAGNLDDAQTVSTDFDLVPNAAPTYQNARNGWLRKFCGLVDGTAAQRFAINDTATWDPNTTSIAFLLYAEMVVATVGTRTFMAVCSGVSGAGRLRTNGIVELFHNSVSYPGAYNYVDGAVHPFLIVYDRENSRLKLFTDKEEITAVYSSQIGNLQKGPFSAVGAIAPTAFGGFSAGWLGADVGALDKRILEKLGWTLAY